MGIDQQQTNSRALMALIFGILSIVLFLLPIGGIIFALLGIVLGIIGRREARANMEKGSGYALAGIICGIVGLIIPVLMGVLALLFFSGQLPV
ncbi:DUF4190 domain-containing protein [Alkalicoccus luteus]|uniref:DUF4190 domain-containing protein n=1 Tax=Alkalicoccus luteus TaxID=1237094 RepID=A0A969PSG6_9BACI|nr:DUF4190 domain-containing protein [Alkalicoccus luteus]NJP37561.1 DUF4190 domain-containing protein [Alkalicoccus luteus]